MLKKCISEGWLFNYYRKKEQTSIDLPHDMVIKLERSPDADGCVLNGYWPSASGRYVKYMDKVDADCVMLDIDGAYMLSEVILNHCSLAVHHHGYTPYLTDLTGKMWDGVNKLEIQVNALQPSTRWYSGGGLYRDVFLWTGGKKRILPRDLFLTTEPEESGAAMHIRGTLTADEPGQTTLQFRVADANGTQVTEGILTLDASAGKTAFETRLHLKAPHVWDIDSPYLYTLHTEVTENGITLDRCENTFGVRTATWDTQSGFMLNGRAVKLRGGCIHHDHGVIGSAAFPDAEERKIRLLKEAGFNAVRIAHNPPSTALLEVCDRLGMLVMDEVFDTWMLGKTPLDYHMFFRDHWQEEIAAMVQRDRNHPCVITWSVGNEIFERDGSNNAAEWSQKLHSEVHQWDDTRPATSAVVGLVYAFDESDPVEYRRKLDSEYDNHEHPPKIDIWCQVDQGYVAPMDVVGYNYQYQHYEEDLAKYPDRIIWGSETHALHIYDSWGLVMKHPRIVGDFTWTAYDNLGEAGTGQFKWARDGYVPGLMGGPYPWRSCYQGDFDLCGYRRPQSYYRETVWGLRDTPAVFTTHPEHYGEGFSGTGHHWYDIHPTWTFEKAYIGKPVKTEVYTRGDKVEFSLNGVSLGKVKAERCTAAMDIPYAPGTLRVVAYLGGDLLGEAELKTVGEAAKVLLVPENETFKADGRSLCYIQIHITDAEGAWVESADMKLKCNVTGGELMGVFSGNPANTDVYGSDTCHAFEGRALAILRTHTPGKVQITVTASGIGCAETCVSAE